jgi:hypothetical protein
VKDVNCFLFFFFNGEVLLVISCGTGAGIFFFFRSGRVGVVVLELFFQYWNCESMNYHCYKLWDKVLKITSCLVKLYDFTSQYILLC